MWWEKIPMSKHCTFTLYYLVPILHEMICTRKYWGCLLMTTNINLMRFTELLYQHTGEANCEEFVRFINSHSVCRNLNTHCLWGWASLSHWKTNLFIYFSISFPVLNVFLCSPPFLPSPMTIFPRVVWDVIWGVYRHCRRAVSLLLLFWVTFSSGPFRDGCIIPQTPGTNGDTRFFYVHTVLSPLKR